MSARCVDVYVCVCACFDVVMLNGLGRDGWHLANSPLFPCALAEVVPTVEHDTAADGEEGGGLEASCGQVALWWETQVSNLVLVICRNPRQIQWRILFLFHGQWPILIWLS